MARTIVIISAVVVIVGAYGLATVCEGSEATHPRAPVARCGSALIRVCTAARMVARRGRRPRCP